MFDFLVIKVNVIALYNLENTRQSNKPVKCSVYHLALMLWLLQCKIILSLITFEKNKWKFTSVETFYVF